MTAPTATLSSGPVRGTFDEGIAVFKGIPYGTAERFMAPQRPAPWTDPRECTRYGPRSPQLEGAAATTLSEGGDTNPMADDCLVLNVWTPALDAERRPVMVWFHGGGFSSLSGSSPMYDGVRLCQRGDVVVVTLNHRLNLFGFCHLAELGGERYADSGVAGMLDLVRALEWVRDEIATFGGDPGNVTVFGESGGGAKVSVLMGMPEARGLFHRAIVQSGVHLHAQDPADATENAATLLGAAGLERHQVDELAAMPLDQVLAAFASISTGAVGEGIAFSPVADGIHLPRAPWRPAAPDSSADVPLVILSTRTETTLLAGGRNPRLFDLEFADIARPLRRWLGDVDPEPIVAAFRDLHPAASASEIFFLITSDLYSRVPGWEMADLKSDQGGAPVWMCELHHDSPVQGGRWGAPHTMDIPLVFDNVDRVTSFAKDTPEMRQVAAQMSDAWIAFARSGDPNHPGIPEWPPYRRDEPVTMLFEPASRVERSWRVGERAALAHVPMRDTNR